MFQSAINSATKKLVIFGVVYGAVKVSTGIVKRSKRAEAHNFLKMCTLKLNANNNKLAVAA